MTASSDSGPIAGILDVCIPVSDVSFRWFGEIIESVGGAPPDPAHARGHLVSAMREVIYSRAFLTGAPVPRMNEAWSGATTDSIALTGATSSIQSGWRVVARVPGGFRVRRGPVEAFAAVDDVLTAEGAVTGDDVAVRIPRVLTEVAPGFTVVLGERDLPRRPEVRVYLNPEPGHRIPIAVDLTAALDTRGVGHRLKVLCEEARGARADPVVLYLARADWEVAAEAVALVLDAHRPALVDRVPLFTRRLDRGVAAAEHPLEDESFGRHRSGILAEAILRGAEEGAPDLLDRLEIAHDTFREAGIDPLAPHRAWHSGELAPLPDSRRTSHRPRNASVPAVDAIAARICDAAVPVGDGATWLAPAPQRTADSWERYVTTSADVYGGTAGIALFLAEHARFRAAPGSREVALAALRHAVRHAAALPWPGDLHHGGIGVLVAALRVGDLLEVGWPSEWARDCRWRPVDTLPSSGSPDLLGGAAGEVLGLLIASAMMDDERLLEAARMRTQALMSHGATASGLAGMAHGSSGVALALLEFGDRVGEAAYFEAAARVADSERFLFDEAASNWRDERAARPGRAASFATAWCHGAPGIALTRLRSLETSPDGGAARDLERALATTVRHLDAQLRSPAPDLSPCHGVTGLTEVILESERRGHLAPGGSHLLQRTVAMIEDLVRDGAPLPSGVDRRTCAGLMHGDSGVGRFLLRIDHSEIPSLLMPGPAAWSRPVTDDTTLEVSDAMHVG